MGYRANDRMCDSWERRAPRTRERRQSDRMWRACGFFEQRSSPHDRSLSLAPMRPQIENILAAPALCVCVSTTNCRRPAALLAPASNRFTTPEPRTLDSTLCLHRSHSSKVHGALDRVVHLQLVGQIDLFHREREGRVGAADLYRTAASTGRHSSGVCQRECSEEQQGGTHAGGQVQNRAGGTQHRQGQRSERVAFAKKRQGDTRVRA